MDDNIDYSVTLLESLQAKLEHAKIGVAQTEEAALELQKNKGPYHIVVCDLKLHNGNGADLCRKIIDKSPQTRVILMSGYPDLLDSVRSLIFGAEKIFPKPVLVEGLVDIILNPRIKSRRSDLIPIELERLLDIQETPFDLFLTFSFKKMVKVFAAHREVESERIQNLIDKGQEYLYVSREDYVQHHNFLYVPIHLSMLLKDTKTNFEIFEYKDNKFVSVAISDHKINENWLAQFKERKVKKLYIKDTDESSFHLYLDKALEHILKEPNKTVNEKAQVLSEFSRVKIREALTDTCDFTIQQLSKVQTNLEVFIAEHNDGIGKLLDLSHDDDVTYQHSLNVATLAYLLYLRINHEVENDNQSYKQYQIAGTQSQDILFYSGLLHDIGEVILKKTFLTMDDPPPPDQMPNFYKEHVEAGIKEIQELREIPPKVAEVVAQHEEYCDGSGFPNGLNKSSISVYGQIISLVNYFDKLITKEKKSLALALEDIKINEKKFNKHFIPLLEEIADQVYGDKDSADDEFENENFEDDEFDDEDFEDDED